MAPVGFRSCRLDARLQLIVPERPTIEQRTHSREECARALIVAARIGFGRAAHQFGAMMLIDHLRGHVARDLVIGLETTVGDVRGPLSDREQALIALLGLEAPLDLDRIAEDIADRELVLTGTQAQ